MNMTLKFWLIAASLGLVSAGLVDPTLPDRDLAYGYGDSDGSRKQPKKKGQIFLGCGCLFFEFDSAAYSKKKTCKNKHPNKRLALLILLGL